MSEPVLDPIYWKTRLVKSEVLHHAIYLNSEEEWNNIEKQHKKVLVKIVTPNMSILDIGCGWGRLLTLLPQNWKGKYLGIDLSPDFIKLANRKHPTKKFICDSAMNLKEHVDIIFDIAILISVRPMLIANIGSDYWEQMRAEIKQVVKRILYLEYDINDIGVWD